MSQAVTYFYRECETLAPRYCLSHATQPTLPDTRPSFRSFDAVAVSRLRKSDHRKSDHRHFRFFSFVHFPFLSFVHSVVSQTRL